ncbi:RNA polymerase sigma-I factor [Bacillus sp. FJAT-45350]|uniref:RNA polymerase sigma-I factor n=1 Tax=Bacillus sp. FJAT-45350 TaxID=2011014 RepID=UPI000BB92D90|nr:RNA polymerase sigma-I factor [Bacillus sp. FJAT-45350]
MDQVELVNQLEDAKKGNELVREQLIRHYRPYIINTVGHICREYRTWSDEEASIGLLAFNRAIDTFDKNGGRKFLNYVYLLIKRDLIDFYRREKREHHLSLNQNINDDDITLNEMEANKSIESFKQSVQTSELVEEILELNLALQGFSIAFDELEQFCPKHKDTRENLKEIASVLSQDQECVDLFLTKKRLPVTAFCKKHNYRPKTLERYRKYLITLILLTLHPNWIHLSQYIQKT